MYTKNDKVTEAPSLSALKRKRDILKRALRKQEKIAKAMIDNRVLSDRLNDLYYENGNRGK